MSKPIIQTLEMLEEKIENIKWLVTAPFSFKRSGVYENISIIRKSAGILGHRFPKGTIFENKARKEWRTNFRKRIG